MQWKVLEIRNNTLLRKSMLGDHQISDVEHGNWLESLRKNSHVKSHIAILGGDVVGAVNLTGIDYTNLRADWGFYVDPDRQGEGIGNMMVWLFLDLVYETIGLNKINAEVFVDNCESTNLHLRFGFVREGVRRAHVLRHRRWHDVALFGLLRKEWLVRRESLQERFV